MGNRFSIEVVHEAGSVFLYTHWKGCSICNTLKASLERGSDRWEDESYLTRIIFSDMIAEDINSNTGYGISLISYTQPYRTIKVDIPNAMVEYMDKFSFTFDDYINLQNPSQLIEAAIFGVPEQGDS